MSKTLYSLLQDSANEEGLFKAMNKVAYTILELGNGNGKARREEKEKEQGGPVESIKEGEKGDKMEEEGGKQIVEKEEEIANSNNYPDPVSPPITPPTVDNEEEDEYWYITLEDFISSIQGDTELCQFFAEQYILDLKGSSVDPVLNSYTRTFMTTGKT